jgi:hypothetical protein
MIRLLNWCPTRWNLVYNLLRPAYNKVHATAEFSFCVSLVFPRQRRFERFYML